MKVDLSYAEMNWIVSALNHKIAVLEEEMKSFSPGSDMDRLADIAIGNHRNLINKMTDAQNDMNNGRK